MGGIADRVRSSFTGPDGVDERHVWAAIDTMMRPGVNGADVYLQSRTHASLEVSGGKLIGSIAMSDRGMGLRALTADGDGFCFTQSINPDEMAAGAELAKAIAGESNAIRVERIGPRIAEEADISLPGAMPLDRRIEMMAAIEAEARAFDPGVVHAKVAMTVDIEDVLLATDSGLLYCDLRPFSRLTVEVSIQRGDLTYTGVAARGLLSDETPFADPDVYRPLIVRAFEIAEFRTRTRPFDGGMMPVVLGAGWSGVLFHEAVGHGLEGDLAARGISPYSGKIGEMIASPTCTIVDDATLPGRAGSRRVDDEGTPGQATILVEDGILRTYMHDRRTARNAGVAPTGNGRRQSYAHLPMPRMTNTYLAPGKAAAADVIASVDRGLYCADIGSGQVDLVSGRFVFGSVTEAYAIEGGKLTYPVSGVRLLGDGPGVIARIGMVADDLDFDKGVATCGKSSQELLVGVGQPTIRVDGMAVGGTA